MKLANKFTLWFIGIIVVTTPISTFITYQTIRQRIDNSEIERLKSVNDEVAYQLTTGVEPDKYTQGRPIHIERIGGDFPENEVEVSHKSVGEGQECLLTVTSYYAIEGGYYKIASYNYVTRSAELLSGMLLAASFKLLIIVLIVGITVRQLSKYILRPFKRTLRIIHHFDLRNQQQVEFIKTSTREFNELQTFVQSMIAKARHEYALVKEFSENASHELQTPLAVISSKLELLGNTDIHVRQAELISDMQDAVNTLSRINHSLLLLTKLENQEFAAVEKIDFTARCVAVLEAFEDGIAFQGLKVHSHLTNGVYVRIHPALADMLLNNLIGNAVKHNVENGAISIHLNHQGIHLSNTGRAPSFPTSEFFHRFKKDNQSSDSVGLGLAIVKQIGDLNHFDINYTYQDGLHKVEVAFNQESEKGKPTKERQKALS